jgi:hypothetical protein
MTDVSELLRSTLESTLPAECHITGEAVRRQARKQQRRARAVGGAALAAASVSLGVGVPRLLHYDSVAAGGGVTADARAAGTATSPALSADTSTVSASPAASAGPCSPDRKRPTDAPPATPFNPANDTTLPAAVPQTAWQPAGELIRSGTVDATARKVVGLDCDWLTWGAGGKLLDSSSATVVFAGRARIDDSGPLYPRPLVVVAGRVTGTQAPALAVLTTIAGAGDSRQLSALTVIAVSDDASTQDVVAVAGGMAVFVVADGGVTKADYIYRDKTGDHTVPMDVDAGVATSLLPTGPDVTPRVVTKVVAFRGTQKIWDGAPVAGR